MHLLAAQSGAIQQEGEAIDLGQSPGEIIFASAADSELAAMAGAVDRVGTGEVRLANIMVLAHNMSVDLWLDQTVAHAKVVVLRLLGGAAYFRYGVDEIGALAMVRGFKLALLPGDANPDPELLERSNISEQDWHRLHALFTAGGPDNMDIALSAFHALAQGKPLPQTAPKPFARFGLWSPKKGMMGLEAGPSVERGKGGSEPVFVPILRQAQDEVPQIQDEAPQIQDEFRQALSEVQQAQDEVQQAQDKVQQAQDDVGQIPDKVQQIQGEVLQAHDEVRQTHPEPLPFSPHPEPPPLFPHPELVEGGKLPPLFIPILFYRAALEGAGTATLERLISELESAGLTPLPLVISTLKEGACIRFVKRAFELFPPQVILNLTGFALGLDGIEDKQNPFVQTDAPIIQLVQAGRTKKLWQEDMQGLGPRDLAMQIVLPEMDGRIGGLIVGHKQEALWHQATQCPLSAYAPDEAGIERVVELTKNWGRLRQQKPAGRRVAIVLANYPIRDGRIANGVGYDAPQSTVEILAALSGAGYDLGGSHPEPVGPHPEPAKPHPQLTEPHPEPVEGWAFPKNGNALVEALQNGPTNAEPTRGTGGAVLPLAEYESLFQTLPEKIRAQVIARWGGPKKDPFCRTDGFHLPVLIFGHVAIVLQPARGYDRDEEAAYHDPDLVPPHAYVAAYLWIRHVFDAHALIHNGKHGNLEWLPGKATALDGASYPQALWGNLPHFYPFIVNDPGEGTQAKRRTGAVIIDHLVPPLTRAETYGPLKDLEALLDEYYAASGMDRRRLNSLKNRILNFARDTDLHHDINMEAEGEDALGEIDNFLCELKEAQIRDGLHVFGRSPTGELERDLIVALCRVPRGQAAGDASLIRALADDLKLGFDPLAARLGDRWLGPRPDELKRVSSDVWRSNGDTVERLELLAAQLVQSRKLSPELPASSAVLADVATKIQPALAACGPSERQGLLKGLAGKFVAPGSSGAPSRGRLDILPTGRNFYSLDNRAVPTQTAWELGQKSAENLIKRHFQDTGNWLRSIALTAWGTANMRTGGDDIAQGLALIGAKPKWDPGSLRVSGYEIIPLARLGRPRVDVTLRISGFFRDAFPQLIALFDRAIRAIGALDEPTDQNPIAATMRTDALELGATGQSEAEAAFAAGHRIFGSKPGAYGAGLQGLMDSGKWQDKHDLAKAFLNWGQYAYGSKAHGVPERARFAARLSDIEAVVHNQDNREHDLLDSDDYYQFEGGLLATAQSLTGEKPAAYHNDHSRPERPVVRSLEEEISHVMRARVVNPKWLNGVMRHGYKGAFEIIATLDYMFAFAATTGAVKSHHFDLAFEAFVLDEQVRDFIRDNNMHGYDELLRKFNEAVERGLWTPKSNSAYAVLNGDVSTESQNE